MPTNTVNAGHRHPEKCLTELDRGATKINGEFPSPSGVAQHQHEPSANTATNPRNNRQALIGGEYIISDRHDNNNQIASARWQFIQAIHRKVPAFGEQLRHDVYPSFARLAGKRTDYWETGWKFSTWQLHSDRNNELTPLLLAWAGTFNLEKEAWILEGALQTLWIWHKFADARRSLDLQGFRPNVCGKILIGDGEHRFSFEEAMPLVATSAACVRRGHQGRGRRGRVRRLPPRRLPAQSRPRDHIRGQSPVDRPEPFRRTGGDSRVRACALALSDRVASRTEGRSGVCTSVPQRPRHHRRQSHRVAGGLRCRRRPCKRQARRSIGEPRPLGRNPSELECDHWPVDRRTIQQPTASPGAARDGGPDPRAGPAFCAGV